MCIGYSSPFIIEWGLSPFHKLSIIIDQRQFDVNVGQLIFMGTKQIRNINPIIFHMNSTLKNMKLLNINYIIYGSVFGVPDKEYECSVTDWELSMNNQSRCLIQSDGRKICECKTFYVDIVGGEARKVII